MTLDGSRLPCWNVAESDSRAGACFDNCLHATRFLLLAWKVRAVAPRSLIVACRATCFLFWLGLCFASSLEAVAAPYAQPGAVGFQTRAGLANATPHPAVARIIVPESDGVSYGSGTLVDVRDRYALVITNWHVVRDGKGTIEVVFPDGFRSPARALKMDKNWDLAALVIWRPRSTPVTLASSAPRPGDLLTIAGYGRGDYRMATGRCTQYLAPGAEFPFEMVELNVEARQGDSGGPIFNERGEMAGVLFGAANGTTSGSYCGRVSGFLASLAPDMKPGQSASERELIASARRFDGLANGLAEGLASGDVAGRAGFRDSDSQWRAVQPQSEHNGNGLDQQPEIELADNPPPRGRSPMPIHPENDPEFRHSENASSQPAALAAMTGELNNGVPNHGTPDSTASTGSGGASEGAFGADQISPDRSPLDEQLLDGEATLDADSASSFSWRNLAGETLLEQIKTVLACIGGCVLLWKLFQFIG